MTSNLHLTSHQPAGDGTVVEVTPQSAGWSYVGFSVHRLAAGAAIARETGDREECVVILSGRARASASTRDGDQDFGEIGHRMSIFSREKPYALYLPFPIICRAPCAVCRVPCAFEIING